MEVIYLQGQELDLNEEIVAAIGFFDGLHKGHMALVDEVLKISKKTGYKKALITFDHHPLYVLGRIKEEKYITNMTSRREILEKIGVDYLLIVHFTKEVSQLSPKHFIQSYLKKYPLKHIVCGFDFHFGKDNLGSAEDLKCFFDVSVVNEVLKDNQKISSSRIRKEIQEGHIEEVNALLGRPYQIEGEVIAGRHIGHTIGFPTANIDYKDFLLPKRGVYAVKFYVFNKIYLGMCNIGINPTFEALNRLSMEINIFDFDEDIYHQNVKVEFYSFIRNEQSFASKEELINQLLQDKKRIKDLLTI